MHETGAKLATYVEEQFDKVEEKYQSLDDLLKDGVEVQNTGYRFDNTGNLIQYYSTQINWRMHTSIAISPDTKVFKIGWRANTERSSYDFLEWMALQSLPISFYPSANTDPYNQEVHSQISPREKRLFQSKFEICVNGHIITYKPCNPLEMNRYLDMSEATPLEEIDYWKITTQLSPKEKVSLRYTNVDSNYAHLSIMLPWSKANSIPFEVYDTIVQTHQYPTYDLYEGTEKLQNTINHILNFEVNE